MRFVLPNTCGISAHLIASHRIASHLISSHLVEDGAVRHQTFEGEKIVALPGRIVLVSRFLFQMCPQISKHEGCAHEDQNAESHLAMDPLSPDILRDVMYCLKSAHCALVPRILCPSVKSNLFFGGSIYLGISNPIVFTPSMRQVVLLLPVFFCFLLG